MKLESLTVAGFMTPFAGKTVKVDFSQLPAGLIALVGGNGEGKTTLLEAAPAGLYRQMMSREGDLKTYAQDRDSAIVSVWSVGDERYHASVVVDGIKSNSSAALASIGPGGLRPLNDGKVSTYDTAVAGIFPPLHVFKASAFASQNKSGSFVKASKKERRDIFASFLGVDRLVAMSETAKACAAEVEKVRSPLTFDVASLRAELEATSIDDLRRQRAALLQDAKDAAARVENAAIDIEMAEQQLASLGDQGAAIAAAELKAKALLDTLKKAHDALTAANLEDASATESEDRERAALTTGHDIKKRRLFDDARAASLREQDELKALTDSLAAKLGDIDAKLAGNAQIQAMADEIATAVHKRQEAEATIGVWRHEQAEAAASKAASESERRAVEKQLAELVVVEGRLGRAQIDAELLADVPCHGEGEYAGCQLLTNAQLAKATLEQLVEQLRPKAALGQRVAELTIAIDLATKAVSDCQTRIEEIEAVKVTHAKAAGYAEKLAASTARVEELKHQRNETIIDLGAQIDQAKARHAAAEEARSKAAGDLFEDFQAAETAMVARHTARRDASLTRRDALAVAVQNATAEHAAAKIALEALTTGDEQRVTLQARIAELRAQRETAITVQATSNADAGVVSQRITELELKAERVQVLRGRLQKLDTELVEWQLLQKALDRDGLPNLEIDQAGPAISATANEILADCFGPRFSLELVTQVPKADGKGYKEEFTVLVTDNANGGVQRDIADLSGGEEVIIDEALKNAISINVNERSQTPMRTCFRDETTGALTKENTQRYIQMLRKVQQLGGFHQVLFISHDPDAYAQADAQIRVSGGEVSIALPPYQEAA